jgi:LuxR family maltose regulon positive regulatory protein
MKLSLLATKTFLPPIPETQVARPRLEQRLDAAVRSRHKLILVSAPPGSGKSSLVAAWAARQAAPAAWISLDASDNDPTRFWSYFLAAIQPRFADAAQALLEELNSAPSVPPVFLPELVNLLCMSQDPLVVVLDDYHAIENDVIHQGILYLLEHMPPQTCLAITTRIDPPLPVHRWRGRGQLTEIRAADLRFTLAEAGEFLTRHSGLELQPPDILKLEERTEGWATGLQLAVLSMQGRPDTRTFIEHFSGSHHFVLEYLMNEVLARQDEKLQRFLLCTSLLESFSAPLCDAVLAGSEPKAVPEREKQVGGLLADDAAAFSSQTILAELERANLFLIPLDEEHTWFRYHSLFASFLQQKLKRLGGEKIRQLHLAAAEWYSANGRVDEALHHALAAENYALAAQIIAKHAMPAASDGRARAVVGWIELLPEDQLANNPLLSLQYAWMLLAIGKTNSLDAPIRNAGRLLEASEAAIPDPDQRRSFLSQLAALRAMQAARAGDAAATARLVEDARRDSAPDSYVRGLAWLAEANLQREQGELDQSIRSYTRSLPLMPNTGILSGTLIMTQTLGQAYRVQGQLQAAEELFRSSLAQAVERGQGRVPALGILQVELAGIEYEKNHIPEARALFEQGEANSQRSGMVDLLTSTALLGARLSRLNHELPQGIQRLQAALQDIRRSDSPHLAAEMSAWLAYMQAEAGSLGEAAAWAAGIQPCPDHNPGYTHGIELFSLARVLFCLERPAEALDLAQRLETLAEQGRSLGRQVEASMLQAECLWNLGRQAEGLACLEHSLGLGEPAGYTRLFLDESGRLSPVVAAAWQASGLSRSASGYKRWLLDCFRQEAGTTPGGTPETENGAASDLTGRELDVLHLLAQGLSYPEIARRLVISSGTVKTHVSHIYAKLGVEGRLKAVQRARELKLIT